MTEKVITWTVETFQQNELPLRSELHLAGGTPQNVILHPTRHTSNLHSSISVSKIVAKPRSKSASNLTSLQKPYRLFSVHNL